MTNLFSISSFYSSTVCFIQNYAHVPQPTGLDYSIFLEATINVILKHGQ